MWRETVREGAKCEGPRGRIAGNAGVAGAAQHVERSCRAQTGSPLRTSHVYAPDNAGFGSSPGAAGGIGSVFLKFERRVDAMRVGFII